MAAKTEVPAQPRHDAAAFGPQETVLVDLAQWLARVMQYSSGHPSCAPYGAKLLGSIARAHEVESPISFTILRDGMLMGDDVPVTHRAITSRLAPHLHARSAQIIRFVPGATLPDLKSFVEILALPVQTTFDRGGLLRLLVDRGVSSVQIVEIAHDIDPQERAAQARRNRLRSFFAQALHQLRAGRPARSLTGNQLVELLDHPEDAVLVLEEDPAALAEAVAGLCLLVRQEEARSGTTLFPKLRAILMMLSPPSHVRMLVGLPPLLAGFRSALVWAFTELFDEDVTRIALPAVRNMASELDIVFYGLATAIAHDGRRLSIARRISLRLHDLPHADATDTELVTALTRAPDDHDSFRREREAMLPEAKRALASRGLAGIGAVTTTAEPALPAVGSRRIVTEIVRLSKGTARFDRLCARLPDISATLTGAGSTDTLLGVLHGLEGLKDPTAAATIARLVTPTFAARVLDDLEKAAAEGQAGPEALTTVKILVTADASAVWDRLERTQNIMMQRTMLDALSAAGSSLLPLLRAKLRSPQWMVVRNAVTLLPRLGGTSKDLALVARHPNEKVRSEIMHALRTMTPDEAGMDVLVWYLSDASREVQNAARAMLRGEVLGTTAISTLERLAADTSQQEPLRRRYVEVLGRCPHDAAAQSLLRLIQPRGLLELGAIRELAAVALRSSPAPSAAALFQEGLSSPVRRVRKACERAAGGG